MILLPFDLAWLIVAVLILVPAFCFLATIEGQHFYTRAHRKDMHDREQQLARRQANIAAREQKVHERELALGRRAHDMATQTKMALHQSADDTVISIMDLHD